MKAQSITVFLAALLLGGAAGAQTDARFPSRVTTRDGTEYKDAVKLRVYPDGILVSYHPAAGGIGLAKLKFQELPEGLQKQYGYDPKNAAEFEKQQAQATDQWRSQMAASDTIAQFRALAELQQAWAGNGPLTYSVSLDANGKLSAQGVAETPPPVSAPEVSPPPPVGFSYPNPQFIGYLPLQGPTSAPVREEVAPGRIRRGAVAAPPSMPVRPPRTR
jgi:hypothetical protein